MSFFSPKIKLSETWQRSINGLNAILGTKKFATDDTFQWQDFVIEPTFTGVGAATTVVNTTIGRYLELNKAILFRVRLILTIGVGGLLTIRFTVPFTAYGDSNDDAGGAGAYFAWDMVGGQNSIVLYPTTGAPMAAGTTYLTFNGIIEVA